MTKGWQDEHDEAWEKENEKQKQEKHHEKYWSEIEDGICSPKHVENNVPNDRPDASNGTDTCGINWNKLMQELKEITERKRTK